jgi:hypothetical protein
MACEATYQLGECCDWSIPPEPPPPPPPDSLMRVVRKGAMVILPKYGWTAFVPGVLSWTAKVSSSTNLVTWEPEFVDATPGQIVRRQATHLNRGGQEVVDGEWYYVATGVIRDAGDPQYVAGWRALGFSSANYWAGMREWSKADTYLQMTVVSSRTLAEGDFGGTWVYQQSIVDGTITVVQEPGQDEQRFLPYLFRRDYYTVTGLSVSKTTLTVNFTAVNGGWPAKLVVSLDQLVSKEMQFNAAMGLLMAIDIDAQTASAGENALWTLYSEPDSVYGMQVGRIKVVGLVAGWWGCYHVFGRKWFEQWPNHFWTYPSLRCGVVGVGLDLMPSWALVQQGNFYLSFQTFKGNVCPP